MNLELWQKYEYLNMKPGLDRIKKFLACVGNPHLKYPVVHLAGTNGKGSTARITAEILSRSGYKTGLYISPHICNITERIQINAKTVSSRRLDSLDRSYSKRAHNCSLTFFEYITALAFIYFAENKIDIAVMETGLGGRFDATNIVQRPLVSIITDIDFDHKDILGSSLSRIAKEKAGIIKEFCPVVSGASNTCARQIIRKVSGRKHSELYEMGTHFSHKNYRANWPKYFQSFFYNGINCSCKVNSSLMGLHQAGNCSLAIAACEIVALQGYDIPLKKIVSTLTGFFWPARFDVRQIQQNSKKTTIILDGAHNPGAMRKLAETLKESPWGKIKRTFIFGMLKDKDCRNTIKEIAPMASDVMLVPVNSPRNISRESLRDFWKKYLPDNKILSPGSVNEALSLCSGKSAVVITGSLYLAGQTLNFLKGKTDAETLPGR